MSIFCGKCLHICQLKTSDLLLNKVTNRLSKLNKHMDSLTIVLKQVEKFLIDLLKIHKKKFATYFYIRQGKKNRKVFFSEKSISFRVKPLFRLVQTKNHKNLWRIYIGNIIIRFRSGIQKKFLEFTVSVFIRTILRTLSG